MGIGWFENLSGVGGTLIEDNLFVNIGIIPGLGGSGSWHAAGVIIYRAKELTFRYCMSSNPSPTHETLNINLPTDEPTNFWRVKAQMD